MMADPRYAIYFVPAPDTALYRFGAGALGYDCFTGTDIATFDALPVDAGAWRELTREPRRYGFHATLKAPFRLAEGRTEGELIGEFVEFSETIDSAPTIEPAVCLLQHFVAIVPVAVGAGLDRAGSVMREAFRWLPGAAHQRRPQPAPGCLSYGTASRARRTLGIPVRLRGFPIPHDAHRRAFCRPPGANARISAGRLGMQSRRRPNQDRSARPVTPG